MSTIENKYKASLLLLDTMLDTMMTIPGYSPTFGMEHRRRFNEATKDLPELQEAGKEVVSEMS